MGLDAHRKTLRHRRRIREKDAAAQDLARTVMAKEIRAAARAGLSKTEIAELAGVTRQTVYDILGR